MVPVRGGRHRCGVVAGDGSAERAASVEAHGDGQGARGVLEAVSESPANARRAGKRSADGGAGSSTSDAAAHAERKIPKREDARARARSAARGLFAHALVRAES